MNRLHFLYHELRPQGAAYAYVTSCEEFEAHCGLFARLRQAAASSSSTVPASPMLQPEVTFDDGHRSDAEFALPILAAHGLHGHFFITAGWTGERAGYMGWDELRRLQAAGHTLGAHGMSHKLLTGCTARELAEELLGARKRLEDGLGSPIATMSLPGGRSNSRVLRACADAGYTRVFTSFPRAEPATQTPGFKTVGRANLRGGTSVATLEEILRPSTGALARLARKERLKAIGRIALGDSLYARLWAALNRQEPEAAEAAIL